MKTKERKKLSPRGAAMVEYAVLLVAVTILAAVGMKSLGGKVRSASEATLLLL